MYERRPTGLRTSFVLTFVVTFLGFLDTHMLIPIMALYALGLGANLTMVGIIVGLYSVTHTLANVFVGRVIDRVGYRGPLRAGLLGDALNVFCYTLCRSPLHLALVRASHGISGGLTGPATMAFVAGQAPEAERGRAMGLYGMAMAMAALIGYGLSGVLASRLGYKSVFYFSSVMLLVGVLLTFAMPRAEVKPMRGASLIQRAKEIWGLLRRRGLLAAYCSIWALYFTFGAVTTLLPPYLSGLGMGASHVAILLVAFVIVFAALQLPGGVLSDRVGRRMPATSGLGLCVLSLVALPVFDTFAVLVLVMAAYGAAYGLLFPSVSALVADHSAPEERGMATGLFHALLTAGVAFGAPTMGWVAQHAGARFGLALSSIAAITALVAVQGDLRRRSAHLS